MFFSFVAEITLYSNEIIPTDAESFPFLNNTKNIEENEESLHLVEDYNWIVSFPGKKLVHATNTVTQLFVICWITVIHICPLLIAT